MDFLILYDQACSRIKYRDTLYGNIVSPVSCLKPRYSPIRLGFYIPSSVEVLGMFRSFGSIPLPHASFMISQMLIIPGKIVALFGPFFIEKFFEVCYNNSTL